ncbi:MULTISPECIES: NAD(P)-dependent oxidoreductase [Streptomyces]|uniref:NAD(P)-dependent oxidoreductase n=1 Tax=Streptomyces dengpaensis TaxID=2049881 RepID=A0ABN5ICE8_9ACTN|nr:MULTISPECIES: NAD(P)-dependent oxidoreductase [Streptomyces]AVH60841.1 NAD(P)-dependent oxidoreductase [Streptomyces dengpaensis]PIB02731.1 6-phosphogluconate dehydrogenase [Streptomyces sp. HG99]
MSDNTPRTTIGWAGTGRMGYAMVSRLLKAGHDVTVYNRTRSKCEPLTELGATVVDTAAELADRDIVFTMVSASKDFAEVTLGEHGILRQSAKPRILVDCSTVSADVSAQVRQEAEQIGTALLAAPVSGNGKVVKAGKLSMVASGPREVFDEVAPLLSAIAPRAVTYAGGDEVARLVKLAHNIFLGVVTQSLAEITVLAEKGGVSRAAFLEFLNGSVMGSVFTQYKTPAFVNLDLSPTFTPELLRKDFDLGLAVARELEVPMPVASLTHQLVQHSIGRGHRDIDFAVLLTEAALAAGLTLEPEDTKVTDGLSDAS